MSRLPALGVALVLAMLAAPVQAGSFAVSPVRLDLGRSQQVASMTVTNRGTQPAVIQLQPTTWRQEEGRDRLESTRELLATPPIFTVPPGGRQIVRVGLRRAQDPARELSYRLLFREILPEPESRFSGLRVALELSVPVFVAPAAAQAAPELRWTVLDGGGRPRLQVSNEGNGHVRIHSVMLDGTSGDSRPIEVGAYLLPGRSMQLDLPDQPPSRGRWRIRAATNRGELAGEADGG